MDKFEGLQRAEKYCRGQDNLESPHSSTFYLRRGHQKKRFLGRLFNGRRKHNVFGWSVSPSVGPFVCPLARMLRDAIHLCLVEEFQWNLLQIFIMELELLTSISSLVVKNQGHDQTECYNDRGMHFTGVAWRLHGWFLFNNLEPFCSVYCLHVVYNICSHLTGNKRSHTNTHIYAMQWNAAVKWLTTRSVQTSANAH